MTNENELDNSQNVEDAVIDEILETDDVEVVKSKYQTLADTLKKTSETNKQLFARAKKAEGFEEKDGKWVKPPKEEKPKPEKSSKSEAKPVEFDYGQKAFLRSFDIKGADEIALVKNWVNRTGDELDAVVDDEIFQSKLKSLREARASAEAIPKGSKRGAQPALNDESYWAQKIESGQSTLADIEDVAMRRKVLNKRIEKESTGNKFSSNPVITT